MNNVLAQQVIEESLKKGIREFCVAPGSRNSPLVYALDQTSQAKVYYWSEERSASFFALGRIKQTERPVGVIVTSGTAAGELLPAAMSAYYLRLPLLLMTADRPKRFRKSGAPQTAEQEGLFGCYAHFAQDLDGEQKCQLESWTCQGPAHLNICFEEPSEKECQTIQIKNSIPDTWKTERIPLKQSDLEKFSRFIETTHFPLVVLGGIDFKQNEAVIQFLYNLGLPVYAEGISNVREEARLAPFRITRIDSIWKFAKQTHYPIDGILRIGEIPTARLWRDLEEMAQQIQVCSISEIPFSGLSWGSVIHTSLSNLFSLQNESKRQKKFKQLLEADEKYQQKLEQLFQEEPEAEPSLVHQLSKRLPLGSFVYLGNSLPIREWDLAATYEDRQYRMAASRGLNGIDGQISTFLGLCTKERNNWALLGDLTAIYDLAGPWILSQMKDHSVNIVIINNRGGQIFSRMYSLPNFTNPHDLNFSHLAAFWGMHYELWKKIPDKIESNYLHQFIELRPDPMSTERFWKKLAIL